MGMKRNGRRGPVRICLMGLAAAGTVWGAVYMIKNSRAVLTAVPWEQQVRMAGEELAALLWHQAAPYEMTGKNSRNITEQDGSNTDQAVKPRRKLRGSVRGNRSQCFRLCPFPGRKPSSAGNRNTLSASAAGGF